MDEASGEHTVVEVVALTGGPGQEERGGASEAEAPPPPPACNAVVVLQSGRSGEASRASGAEAWVRGFRALARRYAHLGSSREVEGGEEEHRSLCPPLTLVCCMDSAEAEAELLGGGGLARSLINVASRTGPHTYAYTFCDPDVGTGAFAALYLAQSSVLYPRWRLEEDEGEEVDEEEENEEEDDGRGNTRGGRGGGGGGSMMGGGGGGSRGLLEACDLIVNVCSREQPPSVSKTTVRPPGNTRREEEEEEEVHRFWRTMYQIAFGRRPSHEEVRVLCAHGDKQGGKRGGKHGGGRTSGRRRTAMEGVRERGGNEIGGAPDTTDLPRHAAPDVAPDAAALAGVMLGLCATGQSMTVWIFLRAFGFDGSLRKTRHRHAKTMGRFGVRQATLHASVSAEQAS
jgi:hypothetical protein